MNEKGNVTNYIPYGDEWRKEAGKLSKELLLTMISDLGRINAEQYEQIAALRARLAELEAGLKPFAEFWKEYKDEEWPPQKVLVRVDLLKEAAALLERKP